MTFNPMNMIPGTGPSLEGKPGQPWYRNWMLWIAVAAVVVGVVIFAY